MNVRTTIDLQRIYFLAFKTVSSKLFGSVLGALPHEMKKRRRFLP